MTKLYLSNINFKIVIFTDTTFLLAMKKIVLSIAIVLFSFGLSIAQQKEAAKIKTISPFELLEGTWVVEHNDKLPTYLKEEYKMFLKDSLFFGSPATHTFGNTTKEKVTNTYQYNDKSKQLMIFNASLEGVEYALKNIESDKLIFSIPNAQLNSYIDLVYIRVTEARID